MATNNNDINEIMNALGSGTSDVSNNTPAISNDDITGNDINSILQQLNQPTSSQQVPSGALPEIVVRDVDPTMTLQGQVESNNWFDDKSLREFVKNNTVDAAVNLGTGLHDVFTHLGEYGGQVANYYADTDIPFGQKVMDTYDFFITKPVTGMSTPELASSVENKDTIRKLADYYYEGGLANTALTLAPTPVGKTIGKGIKGVAKGIDNSLLASKGRELLNDLRARFDAGREMAKMHTLDKIELQKFAENYKNEVAKLFRTYGTNIDEMAQIINKAEGRKGLNLSHLTEREAAIFGKFDKILDEWDDLAQTYDTAEPGNIIEIVQRGVNRKLDEGVNATYPEIKQAYHDNGFFDYGQYITKDGNPVTFPKNKKFFTPEEFFIKQQEPVADLKGTKFHIPEENIDLLAEEALKNPLAKQFLEDYMLAEKKRLRRIPHGLAEVNKEGVTAPQIHKFKENPLFTERGYGNATAEDIAAEILMPDKMLNHAIKGMLRRKTIETWFDNLINKGEGIINKYAKPEDIRFVHRETLNNSKGLKNLNNKNLFLEELPEGVNPSDYLPIDKYSLKAYRDLYFPESGGLRLPKLFEDITYLTKQGMLASGAYLFGNLWGGIHSFITNSNVNMMDDITNAIKTRGALSKQLGTYRYVDPINLTRNIATKTGEPIIDAYNSAMSKLEKFNNYAGSHLMRSGDALLQNTFAELNAHATLRKKGIPFEKRNLDWMKRNMSNEEIYNTLDDIQKASLIYGDHTFLPKWMLRVAEVISPFFRWIPQATESTIWLAKNNPIAYGYLQGALLGSYAWNENKARAQGLEISNPQSGKIYRTDPGTGETRVTETDVIPELTTAKLLQDPAKMYKKFGTVAGVQTVLDIFNVKDKYGNLKKRGDWKDITPDFRKGVRYKNGLVEETTDIDEILSGLWKMSVPGSYLNKTALPIYYGITGQQAYQPYNEQPLTSPEGNPLKPIGLEELGQKVEQAYIHPVYQGTDDVIDENSLFKLQKTLNNKKTKEEVKAEELLKKKRGEQ